MATFRGNLQADSFSTNLAKPGPITGLARLSTRLELKWIAGQRGHPCIQADITSATASTREPADPDFMVLGTNMTSALSTFAAGGGITLTTAGASADQAILAPHLATTETGWTGYTWGTGKEVHWYCDFLTPATITSMILWAGLKLTNTPVVATDDDQVFLRYEAGVASGVFQVISSIANVDTTTSTTITLAASTRYRLAILIDAGRLAHVYLATALGDYVLLFTTTALTDAVNLIPYFAVQASTAAARAATIYGETISKNFG